MTEQELKTRRAPQTFNVRLDLLQQLSERTPKGQWSQWLEQILIREPQGDSYRQDKINWSPNKKIPMPQLSTATATGILSKQKTTIGRLRFWDGFNIQSYQHFSNCSNSELNSGSINDATPSFLISAGDCLISLMRTAMNQENQTDWKTS